ncbi:hypothetical protein E6H22_08405 [Candidatus Bathyarchaeota archaeon]|nr:MAG: hypothetical protein E6H22_08405 [Candidatus Bathyarchaeota archaeon]
MCISANTAGTNGRKNISKNTENADRRHRDNNLAESSMAMQAQADLTRANAIEFSVRDEPWVKYKLEDGTLLFGRLVIPKIFKAEEYDPSGQPIYAWSSQNMFTTICPLVRRTPLPSTLSASARRDGTYTSCPMEQC